MFKTMGNTACNTIYKEDNLSSREELGRSLKDIQMACTNYNAKSKQGFRRVEVLHQGMQNVFKYIDSKVVGLLMNDEMSKYMHKKYQKYPLNELYWELNKKKARIIRNDIDL